MWEAATTVIASRTLRRSVANNMTSKIRRDRFLSVTQFTGSRSGAAWVIAIGFAGLQGVVSVSTQIVLARLLYPQLFGELALGLMIVTLFGGLSNLHGDRYFIRQSDDLRRYLSAIFTLELVIAAIVFGTLQLLANPIAAVLDRPTLAPIIQVLGLIIFYSPLVRVRAVLERDLSFTRARLPMLAAHCTAAAVAIALAVGTNLGVWALVIWKVCTFAFELFLLWAFVDLRPSLLWDPTIVRGLLRFSAPLVLSALLVVFTWNVDYIIVGHLSSTEQLGLYWMAFQTAHYIAQPRQPLVAVAYPILANVWDGDNRTAKFHQMTRTAFVFFSLPAALVWALGDHLVAIAFDTEWKSMTLSLQILAVAAALRVGTAFNEPLLVLRNKQSTVLALSLTNGVVIPVIGWPLMSLFGISGMSTAVLLSVAITSTAGYLIAGRPSHREVLTGIGQPLVLAAIVAALAACFLRAVPRVELQTILLCLLLSTLAYAVLLRFTSYDRLRNAFVRGRRLDSRKINE